ncbi:hypothetical protein GQ54DRAFT_284550 [Martensiomyces pterosporus]|nr:hypothetical protein GQ54DRAFT_284550 [Martensiomyces pterosporus]
METAQTGVSKLLATLQGQPIHPGQGQPPAHPENMTARAPAIQNGTPLGLGSLSQPTNNTTATAVPSLDANDRLGKGQQQLPRIWQVPAGVGADLTRPVTLGAVLPMWAALEEAQKINILLGIAHVGQNKMEPAKAEAGGVARLAKADAASDWVRTLGNIIGDVGVTGKMSPLENLDESVKGEIESSVAQISEILERQDLRLTTESLSYVSAAVAEAMAPARIRNVYGRRPSAGEVEKMTEQAGKMRISARKQTPSRRQSVSQQDARRASSTGGTEGSVPSSRIGSPDPTNAEIASFSDLFGDEKGEEEDKDVAMDAADNTDGVPCLKIKESHRADHVGRMARLLAAADDSAGTASHGTADAQRNRGSATMTRGGRPIASAGVRRGAHAGARTADKLGMMAPRRRTAVPANTALPASGLGAGAPRRRGSEQAGGPHGGGYQPTKKIQFVNFEESTNTMQARELSLKEQRDKAAEEREAKRQKRQSEIEERKRHREEMRKQRVAAAEARDINGGSSDGEYVESRESGEASHSEAGSPLGETAFDKTPQPPLSPMAVDLPADYLTFNGSDPQVKAVYTNTNALTDIDRLRMYCFFNARPMPPGTSAQLEVVLNEQEINDPAHPGSTCKELMIFQADLTKGEWKKLRRFRRS